MARVFFKVTEDALNNITELFKLVHPLRTSMHYTRNAVAQMDIDNPNADDAYFKSSIDPGDNVHGTGYREAFRSGFLTSVQVGQKWDFLLPTNLAGSLFFIPDNLSGS